MNNTDIIIGIASVMIIAMFVGLFRCLPVWLKNAIYIIAGFWIVCCLTGFLLVYIAATQSTAQLNMR